MEAPFRSSVLSFQSCAAATDHLKMLLLPPRSCRLERGLTRAKQRHDASTHSVLHRRENIWSRCRWMLAVRAAWLPRWVSREQGILPRRLVEAKLSPADARRALNRSVGNENECGSEQKDYLRRCGRQLIQQWLWQVRGLQSASRVPIPTYQKRTVRIPMISLF